MQNCRTEWDYGISELSSFPASPAYFTLPSPEPPRAFFVATVTSRHLYQRPTADRGAGKTLGSRLTCLRGSGGVGRVLVRRINSTGKENKKTEK